MVKAELEMEGGQLRGRARVVWTGSLSRMWLVPCDIYTLYSIRILELLYG